MPPSPVVGMEASAKTKRLSSVTSLVRWMYLLAAYNLFIENQKPELHQQLAARFSRLPPPKQHP